MSKEAESKVAALQQQLADDQYQVDTKQVAAAILSRPGGVALFASRLTDAPGANQRRRLRPA